MANNNSNNIDASAPVTTVPSFLHGFRVDRGHEHTHTSLQRPTGSFYLPSSVHDAFLKVYKAAMGRGEDLFLTERHRHIGPVVVDLDFRYEPSSDEVAYVVLQQQMQQQQQQQSQQSQQQSQQMQQMPDSPLRRRHTPTIDGVVEVYCRAIAALVETPREFDVYVTEKPAPSAHKGLVKDGVHLVVPDVVTRPALQLLLRRDALPALADVFRPLELANRVEDVVDEAVIERNNWMMYGSKKPGGEAYEVTRRYRCERRSDDGGLSVRLLWDRASGEPDARVASAGDYVELLSIRNKYDELRVREDQQDRADAFIAKLEDDRRRREAVQSVLSSASTGAGARQNVCEDLELVRKMVEILDVSRVENYGDWVRLGWCLRNIDHRLLETWVEASKRSPKYIEGECPRLWNSMRSGGLGIGTLHMWARGDSPERYRELLRVDLVALIKGSVNATHYDVARVVHHLYRYEYACCNIRNRTWYEFRGHRWVECDSAYSLRKRLSTDVFKEYMAVVQLVAHRARSPGPLLSAASAEQLGGGDDDLQETAVAQQAREEVQKACAEQIKKLTDLSLKLKVTKFKDDVLKECAELFYHERFEDKLNADVNLLGFENGIYDLARGEFREGRPDDYVSFSTGINYVPFVEDHPAVREVVRFWESVQPDREIREYVLLTLASCLSGVIREERFHIWTGSGSNGKSLSVSLFEKSLGQYCCKFPVTLLTQKRAASSSATPEIARAKGRRFAVLQEPSEDERLNVGQLKELSGGDTVQTRELFKAPCEWRPQFKLFLLCNQLPHVPSDDGGTWRRIRVVEFGSKFVDHPTPERPNEFPVDLELSSKIDGWKEHFMALLLQYYRRYVSRPLEEPEAVIRCTRDYQRTNDHMADFVDTCVEKVAAENDRADAFLSLDDAFAELKEWARRDSIPIKVPKKGVLQKYLDRALARGAVHKGRLGYRGFRVRDQFASASTDDEDDDDGGIN